MFATVRSPEVSSIDDLVERLDMLKELAGDRFDELDITIAYTDQSMYDLSRDVERHRDAIGQLGEIGATWVTVPGPSGAHPLAQEFIEGFGSTYL